MTTLTWVSGGVIQNGANRVELSHRPIILNNTLSKALNLRAGFILPETTKNKKWTKYMKNGIRWKYLNGSELLGNSWYKKGEKLHRIDTERELRDEEKWKNQNNRWPGENSPQEATGDRGRPGFLIVQGVESSLPGLTPECLLHRPFSHSPHAVCQPVLSVMTSKHIQNPTISQTSTATTLAQPTINSHLDNIESCLTSVSNFPCSTPTRLFSTQQRRLSPARRGQLSAYCLSPHLKLGKLLTF